MSDRRVLKRKLYSNHPSDYFLETVLCVVTFGSYPYVTWLYNTEDKEFHCGHYFETLHEANEDFNKREGQVSNEQTN